MDKFMWYNGMIWMELEAEDLSQEFVDSINVAAIIERCFGTEEGGIICQRKTMTKE